MVIKRSFVIFAYLDVANLNFGLRKHCLFVVGVVFNYYSREHRLYFIVPNLPSYNFIHVLFMSRNYRGCFRPLAGLHILVGLLVSCLRNQCFFKKVNPIRQFENSYVGRIVEQDPQIHGTTLGACSVHKSNKRFLCKHGSLDVSFLSYDPKDHLI
jgi:hypothetical protein